ncbi:hypothetical protein [Planococcus sp. YIM B11945]|uniref:hypothetical protein n=1 Tax=Planococcus sp. YIM B11945 TaxID=3435410 RepID=UPI003D7C5A09
MLKGDTARLCVSFKDFHGNAIDPEEVTLKIYDKQQLLSETITEGIVDLSQGSYYCDYTADSDFIFEFSGIYFGKPVLSRQEVKLKFN